ncbi:MAG: formylglycine-generating enzyme family protein [Paludibacteraceae bacterium]|nr:formylglycine-generating enzyme family protein [Paludibacteraceae bacterium]
MKKTTFLSAIALITLTSCHNSTTPKVSTYQVNGVKFNMIDVDGGKFKMGAQSQDPDKENYDPKAYENESPVHNVIVGDFYMGETEVTQALWKAVLKDSSNWNKELGLNDSFPAYFISHNDIQNFLAALNDSLHKSKQLPEDKKFTLPTEAQWEYAAKGGKYGSFGKFSGSDNVTEIAWINDNSGDKLHKVAQKKPNELGIYDLCGNVWEWCSDLKGNYSDKLQFNPKGAENGSLYILKGGGYGYDSHGARISSRGFNVRGYKDRNLGFRLVMK